MKAVPMKPVAIVDFLHQPVLDAVISNDFGTTGVT